MPALHEPQKLFFHSQSFPWLNGQIASRMEVKFIIGEVIIYLLENSKRSISLYDPLRSAWIINYIYLGKGWTE